MIIVHKLQMDLACRGMMPRIDAVQGDCNTRMVELLLQSSGEDWEIPEGTRVRVRYCKSDGTKGLYDTLPDGSGAWTAEGNSLKLILAPQMLTAAGPVLVQAELSRESAVAATFTFQVNVEPDPSVGAIGSEDYVSMVRWMEAELEKMLEIAKESGDFAGEQGPRGEPGPSVYEFAVDAGYDGTEEAFGQMLIAQCLPLAGGAMAGEIEMNLNRITELGSPISSYDAVNKYYVDQKRLVFTRTLTAENWTGSGPYTQLLTISGIQDGDRPHIGPVYSGETATDLTMQEEAGKITYAKAQAGSILFTCLKDKPQADISVQMEVLR